MKRTTIGIVDYGIGNLASVWRALHGLGYRCRISRDPEILGQTDLLLLPGVGAFATAMAALQQHRLVEFIQEQVREERPVLGICLGMQLLADASYEHRLTAGLGLIPGEVVSLGNGRWHIGWNTLEVVRDDPLLRASDGQSFYFNHSYCFQGPEEFQIGVARQEHALPVVIRRGKVLGLQFHPEKSQESGRALLRTAIEGLCRA